MDPCFLHYVSQKPWDEGEAWEDFDYWKDEAKELLRHVPEAIVYFSHLTEPMAEMAGLTLTLEMKAASKAMMEEAREKKLEEKSRREERARVLGIDLTSTTGSRGSLWWKGNAVSSPRSARPATVHRITPNSLTPLPNSARGCGGKRDETVVTKVTTNVLVIKNPKRPEKTAKKETKAKNQNKNKTAKSQPKEQVLVKPAVPKLNLEGVNKFAGGQQKSGWSGNHWKKKTGDSKADVDNWRTPSARLATPDRLIEDLRPKSARNWPITPTSGGMNAHKSPRYPSHLPKRATTPKSSRADLATSWRSTPRGESEMSHKLSPYGDARNNQRGTFVHSQERCPDRDYFHRSQESDCTPKAMLRTAADGDPARSRHFHF